MIVMRNIRCRDNYSYEEIIAEDVVTVCGPFTEAMALSRANQFNEGTTAGSRVSFHSDEPDEYRPLVDAPAFIEQEHWSEHWAIVRPMNDVVW
jgi:hypothetical protein